MAIDVTVERSFVNPDYWGGDNSLVYAFKGAGTGGSQMSWVGNTPNAVGTYGGLTSIVAQENLTFDGDDLFVGPLTSPKISTPVHSIVIGDIVVGDYGGIELVGNRNSTGQRVGSFTVHNEASAHADKLVFDMFVTRDGSNNAADVTIQLADTSAVMIDAYYIGRNVHKWYTDDTQRLQLGLTEFVPFSTGTFHLGAVTSQWGDIWGTDLKIANDADVIGVLTVDTINEHTATAGITIDGVLIKDDNVGSSTNFFTDAFLARIVMGNVSTQIAVDVSDNMEFIDLVTGTKTLAELAQDTIYSHPNHTGHVTSSGDGAQTLVVAAIQGQTALTTGLIGTDELLVNDGGVIKRMDVAVMNTYFNANLSFNNYTHPNHTGQITSVADGAQTLHVSAITGQTAIASGLQDLDELVMYDASAGILKRADLSVFNTYFSGEYWTKSGTNLSPSTSNDDILLRNSNERLLFGDGDTGIYENADDELHIMVGASTTRLSMYATAIYSHVTFSPIGNKTLNLGGSSLFWDNAYVDRLYVDVVGTYIDVSGTDMTFTSVAAGTVTLASLAAGGAPAYGISNQIPHMNTGGTDFDYDTGLTYDGTALIVADDIKMGATKKFYLDGGGDTYLYESVADGAHIVVGGGLLTTWQPGGVTFYQDIIPNDNKTVDLGNSTDPRFWNNVYVDRLYIDDVNTYIDISAGDMTFTDINSGTKTLAQLFATSGTVTSVSAGNGMNFTTITGAGSVTMGTPGTLTKTSTSAVTTTSHTHAITGLITMTNGSNNRVITAVDANTVNGEANLEFNGTALMVGTLTTPKAGGTYTLTIGATAAGNTGYLELVGNQTTDATVGGITFHNDAATFASNDVICRIAGYRDADNDAGKLIFHTSDDAGVLLQSYTGKHDSHAWWIEGASELTLTGSALYPTTSATGLTLGQAGNVWNEIYVQVTSGAQSYKVVFNTSTSQFTYEADSSDLRLKKNIQPIEKNVLSRLTQLQGYTFNFNTLGKKITGQDPALKRAGLIAQEVIKVFPETVQRIGDTDYLNIRYDNFVSILVEAIKEQQTEIDLIKSHLNLN